MKGNNQPECIDNSSECIDEKREMKSPLRTDNAAKHIGTPAGRVDAVDKISGHATYIADLKVEGMLHCKTLRSIKSRARITSIAIPELPEGYWIVDHRDVPGVNRVKMIVDDQPFFAEEEVHYIGEPILLVVGPDREEIDLILSTIHVEHEDVDPVFTIDGADALGAEYVYVKYTIKKGKPEKAFTEAVEVFQGEYKSGYQEHIYMEPQGVMGLYENGRVTVYGSMQCPYYVKNALVQGLGWNENRVRVVQTTTGGAFGGKEDYPSIIAGHVAFAALKTGRPVRLLFDRNEDVLCTTKRHPSVIRIRSALNSRKRITGMEVDIRLEGGAYEGLSSVVLQRAMFASTGVYRIDNVKVSGKVLRTNSVPTGAFRGFGGPQAIFAVEMHMHSLAEHLREDPVDFKKKHLLKTGGSTVTGGKLRERVLMPEIIDRVLDMSGYRKKVQAFHSKSDSKHRGIGISLFYHGCAFTGSGEKDKIKAKVKLRKLKDGCVEILVSNVEFGQGTMTSLRKIVARTLDIPLSSIVYENPDTDRVPDSGPTVASRTVMIVGGLLERAARELKARWHTSNELEILTRYEQPDYIEWDQETFSGDAYPVYSWGANVVEVEIDPITFAVEVRGVWGVYDVGRAIDERILRGQIEGGVMQGLGYATVEVMNSREGALLQSSLTDYAIPTSLDFPRMEIELMENPFVYGPYGAKCAGELPFVGAAPALAAAVQCALGIPVRSIPVIPESLLEGMESKEHAGTHAGSR